MFPGIVRAAGPKAANVSSFRESYGPWGIVAGASEGIGAAFANSLASRGLNVALVARRQGPLEALAGSIEDTHGVETRVVRADLGTPDGIRSLIQAAEEVEVGTFVYNAALSIQGRFLCTPLVDIERSIEINCRAPLVLAHHFAERFAKRGAGAILLMSSLAGLQGSPFLATYSSTKAFNATLAEALWYELRGSGVDVMACLAGATATPGYLSAVPPGGKVPSTVMDPHRVAERALDHLGRGPVFVPGFFNKFGAFLMRRLLTRRAAVSIMGRATATFAGPAG